MAETNGDTVAGRAVNLLCEVLGSSSFTAHVVEVDGVYHQNPECPTVEPGDDLLPRRGQLVEIKLSELIQISECGYCRNYFRDHGPGTRELLRLCEGVAAVSGVSEGVTSRGAAINLLRKNWLVPAEFVKDALTKLCDQTSDPESETFALIERGAVVTQRQEGRLLRALWHWEDGWSVVEHEESDVWKRSVVLGFEERCNARSTARVYAEITRYLFKDQADAWRAAKCVA